MASWTNPPRPPSSAAERGRQDPLDRNGGVVGQQPGVGDGGDCRLGARSGRRRRASASASASGWVSASEWASGLGWASASERASASGVGRRRRRRASASGVGVGAGVGLGSGRRRRQRASGSAGVGVGVAPGSGHRWRRPVLRRRRRLDEEINRVVVRVDAVAGAAAGTPFEARTGRRRGGRRPLDEGVHRVAPADRVDRRASHDPQHHRATGRRQPAAVRGVGDPRVDPRAVGGEHAPTRLEERRRRPRRLARDRAAGRRDVDQLQPAEVDRRSALVRHLDELVGRGGAAGLDLRDDQRRHGPGDVGDRQPVLRAWLPRGHEPDQEDHEDDQRGQARAPGAMHRRPPGGYGQATDGRRAAVLAEAAQPPLIRPSPVAYRARANGPIV